MFGCLSKQAPFMQAMRGLRRRGCERKDLSIQVPPDLDWMDVFLSFPAPCNRIPTALTILAVSSGWILRYNKAETLALAVDHFFRPWTTASYLPLLSRPWGCRHHIPHLKFF